MLAAARRDPRRLHIGIDANLDGLVEASTRAGRRPERGGARNAWFVRATAECLPGELEGVTTAVTILLPWGSLLDAMLRPDLDTLHSVRRLCAPGATLQAVVSLDTTRDRAAATLQPPSAARLRAPYRAAGLHLAAVEALTAADLAAVGTTWAGRLAHGRPRPAWRLRALAI